MYDKKTKKEMRSRIAEINLRFEELATLIETEKRQMTDDEKKERDELVKEKEFYQLKVERSEHNPPSEQEKTRAVAFDELIDGIQQRNIPEEYRTFLDQKGDLILRDVQDSSTVGAITPLTIGDIIKPLEKGLILSAVGAKMQYGMDGAWQFPIVAGVEASIVGEDVEVSDTKIDIDKITPKPRRVSISVPVTYQAQNRSAGKLFGIVTEQIAMSLVRVLNNWMFSPTALAGTDGGCFVNPSTTKVATGNAWKDAIALKGAIMGKGVVFDGTPAYVCTAAKYAELEATPRDAGSGLMVLENGKINGIPVFITEYIGSDKILGFGVFSYMLVGQFGTMRLTVDPYTQAKKDRIIFTLNTDFDMLPLRTEAFGISTDSGYTPPTT